MNDNALTAEYQTRVDESEAETIIRIFAQVMNLQRKLPPTLQASLIRIKKRAASIWETPRHRYYTDHKPERHSEVIIRILGEILDESMHSQNTNIPPLSDSEIFVLLASAYLHDIGMQWERDPNLTLEQVRAIHEQSTYEMIIGSLNQPQDYPNLEVPHEYAYEIALVSKAHRGEYLWSKEYEPTFKAGEPMRLRLLSALLQISDGLDVDYTRVNLQNLKLGFVPKKSRIHWWRCHYVESVNVLNGLVNITFEFPPDCIYCEAIAYSVRKQVEDLLEKLQGVLWSCNIKLSLSPRQSCTFSPTKEAMSPNDVRTLRGSFLQNPPCPLDTIKYQLELARFTDLDEMNAVSSAVFLETEESETWGERIKGQFRKYPGGFLVLRVKANSVSLVVAYAIYFPIKSEAANLLLDKTYSYGDIKEDHILHPEDENRDKLVDYYIEAIAALRWVPHDPVIGLIMRLKQEIERKPFSYRILTVCNTYEGQQLANIFGLTPVWSFTREGELHELRMREATRR